MNQEEHENDCYLDRFSVFQALFFSTTFLDPKFDLKLDPKIYETLTCSHIVGCSNDLLLLRQRHHKGRDYYVCNPVAKWRIQIPYLSRRLGNSSYGLSEGFVCEPFYNKVEGNTVVTFNRHYRFRIVRIPWWCKRAGSRRKFKVVVFSSETREWSSKHLSCPNGGSFDPYNSRTGVAHEGRLYFICEDYIMMYDPFNNDTQYQIIDYPNNFRKLFFNIGVCCGKIRISHTSFHNVVIIWDLEQDFSWRLLHHTFLPMLQEGHDYYNMEHVAFHAHHGDVVFYANFDHTFQANLKTKMVKKIANPDHFIYVTTSFH